MLRKYILLNLQNFKEMKKVVRKVKENFVSKYFESEIPICLSSFPALQLPHLTNFKSFFLFEKRNFHAKTFSSKKI